MSQHTYGMECTEDDPCMACCENKHEENSDTFAAIVTALEAIGTPTAYDTGRYFTCMETEAMAQVFRYAERPDLAAALVEGHLEEDSPEDREAHSDAGQ